MTAQEPFPEERPAPSLFDRAEWTACFAMLALMSGALLAPLFAPDQNADAVPWLRLIWLPVYGCIAGLILLRPIRMSRVMLPAALSLVLVGWAFASSRWSIDPGLTFRRSVAIAFTTAFGLYLAARYEWPQVVRLFAAMFTLLAVGSAIAALVFPSFGVHATIHPGAWRGLWYEKNEMGGQMVLGVLACASAAVLSPGRRLPWAGATAACLTLVIMSTSTTALLGALIALGGMTGLAMLRRGGAVTVGTAWIAVAGVAVFLGVIFLAPDLFFGLVGKDATLTGRTGVWEAVLRRVAERPMLGYGYGAFWKDPWGPAWFVKHEVKWSAPNAHNGWLDALLQLGWIGLGLLVAHFLTTFCAAILRLRGGPEAYWAVLFMVIYALFSISESTLLQYNQVTWVLYITTMAKLLQGRGLAHGRVKQVRTVKLFPDEDPAEMWGRPAN